MRSMTSWQQQQKVTIVFKNICSWIQINSFFYMVCQIIYFTLPIGSNNLPKLQVLELGWNKVNARIFKSLSTFTSLKILRMRENNLEGSFTTEGKLYHGHFTVVLFCIFLFRHYWHNLRKAEAIIKHFFITKYCSFFLKQNILKINETELFLFFSFFFFFFYFFGYREVKYRELTHTFFSPLPSCFILVELVFQFL